MFYLFCSEKRFVLWTFFLFSSMIDMRKIRDSKVRQPDGPDRPFYMMR